MNSGSQQMRAATPIFHVPDAGRAAAYYRDVFGFEYRWGYGEPVSFACAERDGVELFFAQCDEDGAVQKRAARPETSADLYVYVQDTDAVYTELARRGAECLTAPENRAYGMRDFNARDLNGYILTFGQDISA